ncbi:MAG: hypothetical protein K8S87_12130 [Planctomycetes bacterium]|nr:hypothetical protein [Planctomycetota bacterium]
MKFRIFSLLLIFCLFLGCRDDKPQTTKVEDENTDIIEPPAIEKPTIPSESDLMNREFRKEPRSSNGIIDYLNKLKESELKAKNEVIQPNKIVPVKIEKIYEPNPSLLGLYWLEDHQNDDGSWSSKGFHDQCGTVKRPIKEIYGGRGKTFEYKMFRKGECSNKDGSDDSGQSFSNELVTGLALLAYMSCGYTHEDGEFKSVVKEGLRYLMKAQHENGSFKANTNNYPMMTYSICTFAMAEAYAMTANPKLKNSSKYALKYLVNSQIKDKDGKYMGWSKKDTKLPVDPMVTSWVMMALKSCRVAGLSFPKHCWDGILNYFASITTIKDGVAYCEPQVKYMPKGSENFVRMPIFEAAYSLCHLYLGRKRSKDLYKSLMQPLKNVKNWISDEHPEKIDFMYWYFALQAMGQYQGKYYWKWESKKIDTLSVMQRIAKEDRGKCVYGSWDSIDAWGKVGGRVYTTAMCYIVLTTWFRTWGMDYSTGASDDWEGISPKKKSPVKQKKEKNEAEKKAEEKDWKESWGDW